jgi:hypothetical protein
MKNENNLLKSPTLHQVLVELLNSQEPKAIKLQHGLWLKYIPAVDKYSPHELIIFRKQKYAEDGRHEKRNWPSHKEAEIVLKNFFKAMSQLKRKITGNLPTPQEDTKKQNEAGVYFFAKSWVWVELVQGVLPLEGVKTAGNNGYRE